MPTTRRRFQVTETDELERALNVAAQRWPDEPRSRLLLRVIEAGSGAVQKSPAAVADIRRAAIRKANGAWDEAFAPGYLAALREDWPE